MRLWCVVAAVLGAAGGAESWLEGFGDSLHADLADLLQEATVEYYEPVINTTYVASVEFDMRAMGPLYNATGTIIDFIAKKQAYPEGFVSVSDGHLETEPLRESWRSLLSHYAGPIAICVVAALLVCALPLAGLFWCCCHWCRSKRRRPFDRKFDGCLKGLLAILLIGLLTLFLFGVVCAFATEEQLSRSGAEAPGSLRAGTQDFQEYLNATQAHARWLLVVNFGQLKETIDNMLNNSGAVVTAKVGEFSRAVSVTTLNRMVQQLGGVQAELRTVQNVTNALRYNAERLNSGLRKVRAQLLQALKNCDQPQCRRLQEKYEIGQLDTQIQYNQMPDVSPLLDNVTALLQSDIQAEVAEGQRVFRDISSGIRGNVQRGIPAVRDAVADAGRQLEAMADQITYSANNASAAAGRSGAEAADSLAAFGRQFAPLRRAVGLGVAAALLAVTALLVWGLLCGVCGKRPDVYAASDCCSKAHGSKCLLCGVGLMFVVGGAAAAVLAVYFLVGVAGQRFLCDPLNEPRGNRLFIDLEKFVDLEHFMFGNTPRPRPPADAASPASPAETLDLTAVLTRCHMNQTAYNTFSLERVLNLDDLQAQLDARVSQQLASLRPAYPENARGVVILKKGARAKLRQLADTGLSEFNFDMILQALETNMTSLSLDSLSAQLSSTSNELMQRPGFTSVSIELREAADLLKLYHDTIVTLMRQQTDMLNETAVKLRDGLRFNHSSLKEAVTHLLDETAQAETFLNTQGPDLILNLTRQLGARVLEPLQQYLVRVSLAARERVGHCGPLSHAYNATRDAACKKILMPVNGYWISLAWCLVLFVPLMVVAQRLARLYLHVDPYPGPVVEAEYLYDAYADRDNVPLANAYKADKRARRSPRPRSADSAGVAGAAGAAGATGAAGRGAEPGQHHARRYNDMAPKHWEEGPPVYHGPTEYERPPPYYYPGPADRQ